MVCVVTRLGCRASDKAGETGPMKEKTDRDQWVNSAEGGVQDRKLTDQTHDLRILSTAWLLDSYVEIL